MCVCVCVCVVNEYKDAKRRHVYEYYCKIPNLLLSTNNELIF